VIDQGILSTRALALNENGKDKLMMAFAQSATDVPFAENIQRRPLVMAHRGGAGLWPENTMYGFERAVDLGVDMLETEIHSTADNILVLMHDSTVDRTTNGSGPIRAFTLEELKTLDAGYNWTSDGGQTFPFRGSGITVPTLEEVFTALPTARINIDIKQEKPSLVEPLCKTIRTFDMTDKVMVASFNSKVLKAFRRVCPEVTTSAGTGEVAFFFMVNMVFLGAVYRPACQAFQVPEYSSGLRVLTKRFVETAHGLNLAVHVWTINEVTDMKRLLALGVDGIVTDYPDRLISLLRKMGVRS
ncbi:MAG: glycerophosphodiester phosphodiesterase, partial [Syntrophobacteria bacterium]